MHTEHDPEASANAPAHALYSVREAQIAGIVQKQLAVESVQTGNRRARFAEDLGADSLDMVELTLTIEDTFGIAISDDEAADVNTMDDLFNLVRGKLPNN